MSVRRLAGRGASADEAPRHAYDPRIAAFLEDIYSACNVEGRLSRDPLAVVKRYADPADREVAALVCSTLAFGSVDLIVRACESALAPLGARPATALARMRASGLSSAWSAFRYRFCSPEDMAALMRGIKRAREERGSLEALFLAGDQGGPDVVDALGEFVHALKALGAAPTRKGGTPRAIRENLLPEPARGSACKRLFLFLRWLARSDDVDPGGWEAVDRSRLVVPLDLHMTRVCCGRLGFIPRERADLRNALMATEAFRLYSPEDPVKYDFALTRPGIDPARGDERFGCA
jgi:uncharacterized protein (TIGR02757 family)